MKSLLLHATNFRQYKDFLSHIYLNIFFYTMVLYGCIVGIDLATEVNKHVFSATRA